MQDSENINYIKQHLSDMLKEGDKGESHVGDILSDKPLSLDGR